MALGTLRPTVKVGFRRFSTPDDDVDRQQPWNIGVIEVFPWSDFMRIGLVTQIATEEPAEGRDTTDFFMTEGLQIAIAWPQRWFTPFASAHVALGFMRRLGEVEGVAVPSYSALASAGGDIGVDVRVFRNISLGVSLGVVKPLERRYGVDPDTREVFSDTFTSTEWTLTGYLGW